MIDRSKLPNSFEFVVTAGARARQLLAGSTPRVEVGDHKKTTVAQREVVTQAVRKVEKGEKGENVETIEKSHHGD
jgi:DNA-directed RNA polymerase omega subunit